MNGNPFASQAGAAPAAAPDQAGSALPVVKKGESVEEWLARAVPALVQTQGLDQQTATDLATQAWNQVNGDGQAQPDAPPPEDQMPPDATQTDAGQPSMAMRTPDEGVPDDLSMWLDGIDFGDGNGKEGDSKAPAQDEQGDQNDQEKQGGPLLNMDSPDDQDQDRDAGHDTDQDSAQDTGDGQGMTWDNEQSWLIDESDPLARRSDEDQGDSGSPDQMAMDAPAPGDQAPIEPEPEAVAAGWFQDQLNAFVQALASSLVQNGNLTPEQAQALISQSKTQKSATLAGKAIKAATLGSFLEAEIHRHFTCVADDLRQQGHLTRSERIALSGAIGDALRAFNDALDSKLGTAVLGRSPFADVDLQGESSSASSALPSPTAMPEQLQQVSPGRFSYSFRLPSALPAKSLPWSLVQDGHAVKLFHNGFSYEPDGSEKAGKFAVFPHRMRSVRVSSRDGLSDGDVAEFISANADLWGAGQKAQIAIWTDDERANRYDMEVVYLLDTEAEAVKMVQAHDAGYYLDLANRRLIPVYGEAPAAKTAKTVGVGRGGYEAGDGFDLDAMRSVWVATKGFIGPQFNRKRYAALDSGFPNTVKMANGRPDRVEGYLMLWGDPEHTDLAGEYFTPETEEIDAIFKAMGGIPSLYHHAFDNVVKSMVVGVIDTMQRDDVGMWVESQIKQADEYHKFIKPLVERNKLGWSSGTLPLARRVAASGKVLRWPAVEGSMTFSPAEWRMVADWPIQQLKSTFVEAGFDGGKLFKALPRHSVSDVAVQLELERLNLLAL